MLLFARIARVLKLLVDFRGRLDGQYQDCHDDAPHSTGCGCFVKRAKGRHSSLLLHVDKRFHNPSCIPAHTRSYVWWACWPPNCLYLLPTVLTIPSSSLIRIRGGKPAEECNLNSDNGRRGA